MCRNSLRCTWGYPQKSPQFSSVLHLRSVKPKNCHFPCRLSASYTKQIEFLLVGLLSSMIYARAVPSVAKGGCRMDRRLAYAIQRLSDNSRQRPQLPLSAKEVGLSGRRLEQLFQRQVGVTFVSYSRELRMQKARSLLAQTFKSIKEVASEAGYKSVQSFCRDFRRFNGCTATAFREHFGIG